MNSSASVRAILIFIAAAALALWLGVSVATDQFDTLFKVLAAVLFITCVLLGRKIWLLLILFTAMNVPLIRGFGTTEMGQALFIGFTTILTLMRRQPYKLSFGEKEIWMLLLAASIVQAYVRNPVGLNMFGAGNVGARPYFVVAMAFLSSLILGNIVVSPREIAISLKLSIIASLVGVGLTSLRLRGLDATNFAQGNLGESNTAARIPSLGTLANVCARTVASFVSPLKGLFHPLWALVILTSLVAATMSGYRNSVASVGLIYLVGMAYRGGGASVLVSIVSGALLLALLAFVNLVSPLPGNVQRALSPFPGTWEERYVEAADASTEWRVEMWKEALFTDYWIQNKLLGDGLGFTRRELLLMEAIEQGTEVGMGSSGLTIQQEGMMIAGGYHSGPVQTIRTVGYVGLLVLVLGMCRMAVHAHRQIRRCRGTEWYPLSLYIGIPAIILPIFFTFVFGDFGKDVAALFLSYGMISLLEKNLPLPAYVKPRRLPFVLSSRNLPNPAA
jgi:hypothetical protein